MENKQKTPETNEENPLLASGKMNEKQRQALEVIEEARGKTELPSFGSELFMGHLNLERVVPFPQQSEADKKEGDAIIDPLMDYLLKHLNPEEVDATRTIPDDVIKEMGRMGIFALKIPKEYGGLELSQTNYNRLVMKVASYCGGTAVLISAHQSIGVPQPLKMFGTEEQKKKYFPRFRKGDISAFALTEEDVGSDPAQMSTTATLSEDGKYYTLNGSKLWCTNGILAKVIVVMAKTAPKMVRGKERKQISAFILEMDTPGVEIAHRCEFMGLGGIYNGLLKFNNVKIPAENLIGEEGRGLALALSTVNVGRLTLPAACTGGAKACLAISRIWGNQRVQWGMPIGLHETGREKISFIAATTFAMEAVSLLTSHWQDEGKVDIRIEAAMAKLFCTEALWQISDRTMQLRGGRGYEKARSLKARGEPGYPVERVMRDCRINLILEGTSEIMKLFLAREALEPHLKKAGALLDPKTSILTKSTLAFKLAGFYIPWYSSQWFHESWGSSYADLKPLSKEFQYIQKSTHKLSLTLFNQMMRYQAQLEKRQMILGRLMEIGTDLFVMTAACGYALSLKDKEPSALKLAEHFCSLAKARIRRNFHMIDHNNDRQANELAKDVLNGDMTWLEKGIAPLE